MLYFKFISKEKVKSRLSHICQELLSKKKLLLIIILAVGTLQAIAQAPRKVLIEEFTGSWCGYCPEMISDIDATRATYPTTVIAVADHGGSVSNDPMTNNFTIALNQAYQVAGYPTVMVDRADWSAEFGTSSTPQLFGTYADHHNYTQDAATLRLNISSPVSIYIASTYNSTTRVASVTVTANFVDTASGDMRISCLLVEDKVTGGSNYSQHNYGGSGCGAPDATCEFYNYPCVIPTSLTGVQAFYHKNVVRTNLAPRFGTTGVIPSSVSAGQHYSKSYSYTLPSAWKDTNMKVVAFVSYYNAAALLGGEVLNAQQVALGQSVTAVTETPAGINNISLDAAYPNPFNQITSIKVFIPATQFVSVKIYDLLGNEVSTLANENLSPGGHIFYWDGNNKTGSSLASGLYIVRLQTENQSLARSIILARY